MKAWIDPYHAVEVLARLGHLFISRGRSRRNARRRQSQLTLGGWANPHGDPTRK